MERWYVRTKWWLVLGLLGWLGSALPGIIDALRSPLPAALDGSIDWIAACVPYFFFAALLGFLIDRYLRKERAPEWVWCTLAFLVIGVVAAFITLGLSQGLMPLIFPLAYGIFFTSAAFSLLSAVVMTAYGKLLLNLAYLGIFGMWLSLSLRVVKGKALLARRILLAVLFLVLLIGLVSCAQQLS